MDIVKDKLLRLISHRICEEKNNSNETRSFLRCKTTGCGFKATMYIVSKIKSKSALESNVNKTYQGWLMFTGFKGKHEPTKKKSFKLLPGFEILEDLYENHGEHKYNLVGVIENEKESVYK